MIKYLLLCFCPLIPLCSNEEYCEGPQHKYLEMRYTAPKGVGFTTSYTSVQGFFAPVNFLNGDYLPFLDGRGHIFNNGKWAANAGLGFRYLNYSRLWGMNLYYDYRQTSHDTYNQIAFGLETLGEIVDFRINGYFPIGTGTSSPFNNSASFQGNSLFLTYTQTFAMTGGNAELSGYFEHSSNLSLYLSGGPYYFNGGNQNAWGGEMRLRTDLFYRYLRLEGSVSYDTVFHWIGQGQVSLNIPFGEKSPLCKYPRLEKRAAERVQRFEIIPQNKKTTTTTALNPATGAPWTF